VRASDNDRQEAIRRLRRAFDAGLLSIDTFEARVDGVVAVRDVDELARLTDDVTQPTFGALFKRLLAELIPQRPRVLSAPPNREAAFSIGRNERCNCVIGDSTVSRIHAHLSWEDDHWLIRDMGSLNGTYVNGWRVGEAPLADGDHVRLGGVELRFRAEPGG
jgi:pSer/pThr/pTyr-binding forkhead associated (FHA) protein